METANLVETCLSKQDLWSSIQATRATQSASLKVLQRFVLSLSKNELRHMIQSYLKSKLSPDLTPSTCRQFHATVLNDGCDNSSVDEMDQNILSKMNGKYGSKYSKRIISKMQQHQVQNNSRTPQLISMLPPQVLTYSFQYLSFTELCKLERVSCYFTYLQRKYRNLSHYFILLGTKFWQKAMANKINLSKLSQFKHIKITACYRGSWDTYKYKKQLFERILHHILSNSIRCIETLEIDVPKKWTLGGTRSLTMLNHILSSFNPLPISKLIWKNDTFQDEFRLSHSIDTISDKLVLIKQRLLRNCKNLKHISFGVNDFGQLVVNHRWIPASPTTAVREHIILPFIQQYSQLQSLELHCPSWNVFDPQFGIDIVGCIAQLQNIEKLSILSYCDPHPQYTNINAKQIKNVSLKELNVKFGNHDKVSNCASSFSYKILWQLFSTFIGIAHFQFTMPLATYTGEFDWYKLFHHLWHEKVEYSMNHSSVPCLESLQIKTISSKVAGCLVEALVKFKDEFYLNLKHFGINIASASPSCPSHIPAFVNQLESFLITYQESSLHSLHVACGSGYKIHERKPSPSWRPQWNGYSQWTIRQADATCIPIEASYCEPILKLLSALPNSLTSFKFTAPRYKTNTTEQQRKIREHQSMKVAQKLCKMLSDKSDSLQLQSVVLDRFILTKKAKDFLRFIFGFNNKFQYFKNGKYYLNFQ
eukprot:288_1